MVSTRKAVYFFCHDPTKDPVASRVFETSVRLFSLAETELIIDGHPVLIAKDINGNSFSYVRTDVVMSHDFARYLPILNEHFADFDFAGLVNWHGGKNAPDAILTVHTTGDVVSGNYSPAHPIYMRNLMLALEANRTATGLDDFRTTSEATHWSGIPYGGQPDLIPHYAVPLVDVEIGSTEKSWSNPLAAEVVARALQQAFEGDDLGGRLRSLLCAGGVHLESSFSEAVLKGTSERPLAVSHILPNHWMVAGEYDNEAAARKLEMCVLSIASGIHAVIYHDDLKGRYKIPLRALAENLGIPMLKHRALRQPDNLPLW